MSFLSRILNPPPPPLADLWNWITATAREPRWYLRHAVADTVDGRFDMVALVTALVMLEMEGRGLKTETSVLTERFVDDMDGSLRDIGIGDMVIGKHMGRVMGALGGRLGSYRAALVEEGDAPLAESLARNVYRGEPPEGAALDLAQAVRALAARIAATPDAALLAGDVA
ncbi:ubiquinol-cytochrome C chaperone [Sandaracinobacter sp. RS1-74]|uniref:ubiquinol-cytochrome C chaperone family protein n=1 Tax=Sandaracinobacteroides sayramensis TaxID=2913411 RepID=UPI001EDC2521|nr:ubiquinol-cytochrome C chaperone family protein [Sandaracinobacteroides sayramensis]MCG2842560.1 ubiquinol-cytochrome C chaperone [Sandaracinobacteroides sayramensis]